MKQVDEPCGSDLSAFRRRLHAAPELSEAERETARTVAARLRRCGPNALVEGLGAMGTGVCALFEGGGPGPTVLLRAELDALPIRERNDFDHRSRTDGVSHKCGHDGHMATLVAVAESLQAEPPDRGRVLLLFQPAEETGTGAEAILGDERFRELPRPDHVYAFHNVPKYPLGEVLVRDGTFAQGSVGFVVEWRGRTTHSSYPEHGISPTVAVADLLRDVGRLGEILAREVDAPVLGTVSGARIGGVGEERNFGIAPGEASVSGVLRAQSPAGLRRSREWLARRAAALSERHGLEHALGWHEEFTPTISDAEGVAVVVAAARRAGLPVRRLEQPFRWSEDFGRFTDAYGGAFFGLGSGVDQPQLHDERYDYPDELIAIGAGLYRAIVDRHLRN